jgi:hypothetical protein
MTDYEVERLTETVASLGLTVRELVDRLEWVRALVTRWNQESGDEDGYTGGFAAASHLCAEELLAVLEPADEVMS